MCLAVYCLSLFVLKGTIGPQKKPSVPPPDPSSKISSTIIKKEISDWDGEWIAVTGIVSAHPDPRPSGCVYRIDIESVEQFIDSRKGTSIEGFLSLHILKIQAAQAAPGDRIRARGRIQKPRSQTIPGVFDYQEYLANHGIPALMYTSTKSFENFGFSGRYRLTRWGWILNQKATKIFRSHLTDEQATVLAGLVVGNRPRFNPEIKRIFIESGTMHVLVASGSNVAYVIAIWFLFMRLWRLPQRLALVSALPALWLYVVVAGADAPIVRAGLMGTTGIVSLLLKREDRPTHALGLTAFILLILQPRMLFDIGFQMSFVTVFGLIYFLSPLETLLDNVPVYFRWPLRILTATLTAQLWLAPITLQAFSRIFPIGLVSNLLVVPLSGLGLTIGLLLSFSNGIPWIGEMMGGFAQIYLIVLIQITRFFADHGGGCLWWPPFSLLSTVGYYGVLLAVVYLHRSCVARCIFLMGLFSILGGSILSRQPRPLAKDSWIFTWVDGGTDLSTLIETSQGKKILIQPESNNNPNIAERTLMPFFTHQGVRSLDLLVNLQSNQTQAPAKSPLEKWLHISTVVNCQAPLLWVRNNEKVFLFIKTLKLKSQDILLSSNIQNVGVIQGHFPRNWKWRQELIERMRPQRIVETNFVTPTRPTHPPWENAPLLIPQNQGWQRWEWTSSREEF